VTRTPVSRSKVKAQLLAGVLNSQHDGTGVTWRINTKILSTCRGRSRHIVSPWAQLVLNEYEYDNTAIRVTVCERIIVQVVALSVERTKRPAVVKSAPSSLHRQACRHAHPLASVLPRPDYSTDIVDNASGLRRGMGLRMTTAKYCEHYVSQSVTNVLHIVSCKLSIFALKHQSHVTTWQYCIWPDSNTKNNCHILILCVVGLLFHRKPRNSTLTV